MIRVPKDEPQINLNLIISKNLSNFFLNYTKIKRGKCGYELAYVNNIFRGFSLILAQSPTVTVTHPLNACVLCLV